MSCKRLLLGHGYLGKRVAEIWRAQGDTVTAVTRSGAKAEVLQAEGYRAIVADVTQPATLVDLPSCDTLLYAVGYDRTGDASIHEVYAEGFANVLAALPAGVRRVIYISTTGVYGGANGKWVDEATPTDPQRPGGRASLAAEEALRASRFASRGAALRLAGLYGPDRLPYLAKLREGTPLEASPEGWLNLIHVDDAAAAVVAAADVAECVAELAPIISVCDGAPSRRATTMPRRQGCSVGQRHGLWSRRRVRPGRPGRRSIGECGTTRWSVPWAFGWLIQVIVKGWRR